MQLSSWLERKNVRQGLFIVGFLILWELVALSGIYPPLLFPDLGSISKAFVESIQSGEMLRRTGFSLYLIGAGLGLGIVLAFVLAALAMVSRFFADLTESVVAILHPLPGIALLPIVLLWFGTGSRSIIVIIVHSVLWPLMLNTYTGFRSVSKTQLEVGRNIGLKGLGLVRSVMVPAAFPYILAGLKIAWARSWRALVAAEMVFGASGSEGGLGWLIYQHRFFLDIPGVFAGLVMIIAIGVLVEDLFFAQLEQRTVERWGMTVAGG
jgi:NitT/TauT family transport system permease protein